ncbi:hypothetical protein [Cohnella sp.]|uniref:hypothetical protein n=1 Tax=Cohnella sp. TaxID=1883426 RepID=UPI003568F5A1
MTDTEAASWFGLCTAWLRRQFGDFAADKDVILDEETTGYSVDVQLGVLWKNPECRRLLLDMLPILEESSKLQEAMGAPLRMIVKYGGGFLSEDELKELDERLREVPFVGGY